MCWHNTRRTITVLKFLLFCSFRVEGTTQWYTAVIVGYSQETGVSFSSYFLHGTVSLHENKNYIPPSLYATTAVRAG
jgi:hypothetical protein